MTKCIITRNDQPVIDWRTAKPRVFHTREAAKSWAKLSCYGQYTIKLLKEDKHHAGGSTN